MIKRLKILHIGNVAGVASTLANEQKKMNHKVTVMAFNRHCLLFKSDHDNYVLDNFPLNIMRNISLILKLFPRHDILHFHARSILPFYLDLPLWKLFGKIIIIHYHGSDIRNKKNSCIVNRYADNIFVSTPDLLEWVPDAIWVPNPKATEGYSAPDVSNEQKTDSIIIAHAPTNRDVKGTQYIVDAVDHLRQEGLKIELRVLEGLPHDQVIREFSKADIIIDQLLLGWYGVVTIEGMSLKKPVCVYIRDDLTRFIPKDALINCNPETIYAVLKTIINNKNLLNNVAATGYKYVCQYHNVEGITKNIIARYIMN